MQFLQRQHIIEVFTLGNLKFKLKGDTKWLVKCFELGNLRENWAY